MLSAVVILPATIVRRGISQSINQLRNVNVSTDRLPSCTVAMFTCVIASQARNKGFMHSDPGRAISYIQYGTKWYNYGQICLSYDSNPPIYASAV